MFCSSCTHGLLIVKIYPRVSDYLLSFVRISCASNCSLPYHVTSSRPRLPACLPAFHGYSLRLGTRRIALRGLTGATSVHRTGTRSRAGILRKRSLILYDCLSTTNDQRRVLSSVLRRYDVKRQVADLETDLYTVSNAVDSIRMSETVAAAAAGSSRHRSQLMIIVPDLLTVSVDSLITKTIQFTGVHMK